MPDYRDGCPVCGGEGRAPYPQAHEDQSVPAATQPCPECARVAALLKDEREAAARIAEKVHLKGDVPKDVRGMTGYASFCEATRRIATAIRNGGTDAR